jgi:hypothetical protein
MKRPAVDLLPAEVRALLEQELRRRGFGQFDEIVELLRQHGVTVSRSAVGRFSQRLQRQTETIQATTEAARAIAGIVDEKDDRSAAVIALVQSQMFESLLAVQEVNEEEDASERVQLLAKAARAMADVSRASISQKKWALEMKARLENAKTNAAESVSRIASTGGLSADLISQIRREVLGIQA